MRAKQTQIEALKRQTAAHEIDHCNISIQKVIVQTELGGQKIH